MADKEKVEYRVLKPVFVNGTLCDPAVANPLGAERRGKHVYVWADPGLEGTALELVKNGKKSAPLQGQDAGSGSEGSGSGEGSQGAPGK